jgi:hypothetical protein
MGRTMRSLIRLDLHATDRIRDRLRRCRCPMQIVRRWVGMFHTSAFALRISGDASYSPEGHCAITGAGVLPRSGSMERTPNPSYSTYCRTLVLGAWAIGRSRLSRIVLPFRIQQKTCFGCYFSSRPTSIVRSQPQGDRPRARHPRRAPAPTVSLRYN